MFKDLALASLLVFSTLASAYQFVTPLDHIGGQAGPGGTGSSDPENDGFFLDANGVTIKCPTVSPGDTGLVDGVTYTAVDDSMLQAMDPATDDYTAICTSLVTNMLQLFSGASSFNQPIGHWDTSNVTDMNQLFSGALAFNQPIRHWDTSNVVFMASMFNNAQSFNQPIGQWNTSNVFDMGSMFSAALQFNQPIGSWNTANVSDMGTMFLSAENFNQDLSNWCVSQFASEPSLFSFNAPLSSANKPNWGAPCP